MIAQGRPAPERPTIHPMDIDRPLPLLGGRTPRAFVRSHWQRRPLVVRGAWPFAVPPVSRSELFRLAADEEVESRLVVRERERWTLRHGPLPRRALPPLGRAGWTLLVQGVDLHLPAAHRLLAPFRFLPQARLDDVMISYASDGGGVGPHIDSYDVFLLQLHGRRRWHVGPVRDPRWRDGVPLRLLRDFAPQEEHVLEPGDLLYVPPNWGHDGLAVGECMTASIGFRAPSLAGLGTDLLQRIADAAPPAEGAAARRLYRDPARSATAHPGQVPEALVRFGAEALARALDRPDALAQALGESLSEPKPAVRFEAGDDRPADAGVQLDRRTRMLYDDRHVFINGESFRAGGRDARTMRRLADHGHLDGAELAQLSAAALSLVDEWVRCGWLQPRRQGEGDD